MTAERETLAEFLDHYRAEVAGKLRGVSEADARRRLVPSLTTLGGLVKHLTLVEQEWFLRRLGGRDLGPWPTSVREFTLSDDDTVSSMLEETARHAGHLDILREQIDAGD